MSDLPILVIAGDYGQYMYWCYEQRLNPRKDAVYISSGYQLNGRSGNEIVFTGTWGHRRDAIELYALVQYVRMKSKVISSHGVSPPLFGTLK